NGAARDWARQRGIQRGRGRPEQDREAARREHEDAQARRLHQVLRPVPAQSLARRHRLALGASADALRRIRSRGDSARSTATRRSSSATLQACAGHPPGRECGGWPAQAWSVAELLRSEEHTSELQSLAYLVCRLLPEKKNTTTTENAVYK